MIEGRLISRYICCVLLISVACCAFAQGERSAEAGTDNFLVFCSMDGEQVTKLDAQEAQILWAAKIDTSTFYGDIGGFSYSVDHKPYIRGVAPPHLDGGLPDSSKFVIKINNRELGSAECEPTLLFYGQFDHGLLTMAYYVEIFQGKWPWKAVDTYLAVVREEGRPRVKLDAVLETIKFGLACYIQHPNNDEGVYDAIHHYMRIHAEFEVPEDVFKLLGKAAEPEVKPID